MSPVVHAYVTYLSFLQTCAMLFINGSHICDTLFRSSVSIISSACFIFTSPSWYLQEYPLIMVALTSCSVTSSIHSLLAWKCSLISQKNGGEDNWSEFKTDLLSALNDDTGCYLSPVLPYPHMSATAPDNMSQLLCICHYVSTTAPVIMCQPLHLSPCVKHHVLDMAHVTSVRHCTCHYVSTTAPVTMCELLHLSPCVSYYTFYYESITARHHVSANKPATMCQLLPLSLYIRHHNCQLPPILIFYHTDLMYHKWIIWCYCLSLHKELFSKFSGWSEPIFQPNI